MPQQNFKNHTQLVPFYHYILSIALVGLLIGAIASIYNSCQAGESVLNGSLILLIAFSLVILAWYARTFALKAQDRAIRAEENLRHFSMTGKLLNQKLKVSQIIALRFAPDEEFVNLANRAVSENLSAKEIKQAIQNWKGDYYRV